MKFAVVTDIHFGPAGFHQGIQRKLTQYATALTTTFVETMNQEVRPALVLQLGDLIEDADVATDEENFTTGLALLNQLSMPLYHVIGNHDQMHFPLASLPTRLGQDALYDSFDAEGVHFIALHSHLLSKGPIRAHIDEEQLAWLQADLAQTALPTVVFTHYSLADQSLAGNYWFAAHPDSCLLQNRHIVRQVLADSGKVKLVLNGHLHWNQLTMHDGIPYITIQSLTENAHADGIPTGAYAVVTMAPDELAVDVHGTDPATYRF